MTLLSNTTATRTVAQILTFSLAPSGCGSLSGAPQAQSVAGTAGGPPTELITPKLMAAETERTVERRPATNADNGNSMSSSLGKHSAWTIYEWVGTSREMLNRIIRISQNCT
jgi:hypothetical protein